MKKSLLFLSLLVMLMACNWDFSPPSPIIFVYKGSGLCQGVRLKDVNNKIYKLVKKKSDQTTEVTKTNGVMILDEPAEYIVPASIPETRISQLEVEFQCLPDAPVIAGSYDIRSKRLLEIVEDASQSTKLKITQP